MPDVIGLGTPFVDYFYEASDSDLERLQLEPESDLEFKGSIQSFEKHFKNVPLLFKSPGGMVTNTLAVLAKLGLKVDYPCILGNCSLSNYWYKNTAQINKKVLKRNGFLSLCACILSNKRSNRAFVSKMNPFDNEIFNLITPEYLNSTKIVYLGPFLNNPAKNIKLLTDLVYKINAPKIFFSPSIIYARLGLSKLANILKKTEVVFVNEAELKLLTNLDPRGGSLFLVTKTGTKIIVCTLGANGSLITTKNSQDLFPAKKIKKIIDATGAGDTYAAGFLYSQLNNESIKVSAEFSARLAAQSLKDFGVSAVT